MLLGGHYYSASYTNKSVALHALSPCKRKPKSTVNSEKSLKCIYLSFYALIGLNNAWETGGLSGGLAV